MNVIMKRPLFFLILTLLLLISCLGGYAYLHYCINVRSGIPSNQIHYVSKAVLTKRQYSQNGWYYDGHDWAYVRWHHRLTGTHTINGVQYHFAKNGKQILPYRVNYHYQLSAQQGSNQRAHAKYIILHDIGNAGSGREGAAFMKATADSNQAYTNFVVGSQGTVYQIKRPGTVAWGAGTTANANAPVQIELGHTTNQTNFAADYHAYVNLARDMAGKYNIPLILDRGGKETKGIKSHLWVSRHLWGDHHDPYGYLKRRGVSKQQLAHDLKNGF